MRTIRLQSPIMCEAASAGKDVLVWMSDGHSTASILLNRGDVQDIIKELSQSVGGEMNMKIVCPICDERILGDDTVDLWRNWDTHLKECGIEAELDVS